MGVFPIIMKERMRQMLGIFKKNQSMDLYSPVDGKRIALENVPDQVFASKMMGDGVAFELEGNAICAPCNGKVTMIANTLHAIGITASNGAEILIHVGLDTVNLEGKGFKRFVEKGSRVRKGELLLEIDKVFMEEQAVDLTTPMVVTNGAEVTFVIEPSEDLVVKGKTKLITFK